MSITGGLPNALRRGREVGCSVVQIFLKNQMQWAGRHYLADEVAEFGAAGGEYDPRGVAHATYLINLAAPDEADDYPGDRRFHDELEQAEHRPAATW